ncbi:MAG: glycosyltransferase family 4 protein [Ignavibacteria bacterium]|nr:glycosyltransferase family 4 protein [Ignavibacteria bacterium]
MKKVLIISYYFPPSGGPGVQRVLKFVKYLPLYGWKPYVLTVKDGDFPARDESLLNEIPPDVKVYRTKILEPYSLYRKFRGLKKSSAIDVENIPAEGGRFSIKEKIVNFIRSNFFIPDARIAWKRYALKEGLRVIEEEKIDLIYSSSPPYTCSLIARDIKRKTGIKWVAGFRDPWTDFLNTPKRYGIARRIDRKMEHSVFREADAVDVVCSGIEEDIVSKYSDVNRNKIFIIPNGYDESDFPVRENEVKNNRFTVTYTGSMYGVRNPSTFLKALEELYEEGFISPENITLNFIGRFGKEIRHMLDNSLFRKSINVVNYVSHSESIIYLLNSDALLLIVDDTKDVSKIITGKVFEYIRAKKPIIAIGMKDSDMEKLLSETGCGRLSSHNDVDTLKDIIKEYYTSFRNGIGGCNFNDEAIRNYSRQKLTGKLSAVFTKVLEGV